MPYHKYVFDQKKRVFVVDFEKMYQQENEESYDSWNSSNLNTLAKRIHLQIINQYNFNTIIDFGCGKGSFTQLLKKRNNIVWGLDISPTAINTAKVNYGSKINFDVIENNDFTGVVNNMGGSIDLTLCLEVLSYIEDWKKILSGVSNFSQYVYVSLYIPPNPIGFVKSFHDLLEEITTNFDISEKIIYNDSSIFVLAKNRKEF